MEKYKKSKVIRNIVVVGVTIICLVWCILCINVLHIYKINLEDYCVNDTGTEGYVMYIDAVVSKQDGIPITRDYITIDGWVINQNVSFDRVTIDIVLKNINNEDAYIVPTTMIQRTDVDDVYGTDYKKYIWSGFNVRLPYLSKINTEENDYEIMALISINDDYPVLVDSGRKTSD